MWHEVGMNDVNLASFNIYMIFVQLSVFWT